MTNPMKLSHRGAAALLLLFGAGHTVGTFRGRSPAPEADSVLVAMRTVRFDFKGVERTFYDLFFGHALLVSVYLLGSAFVAWFLASVEQEHWPAVAPWRGDLRWRSWLRQRSRDVLLRRTGGVVRSRRRAAGDRQPPCDGAPTLDGVIAFANPLPGRRFALPLSFST